MTKTKIALAAALIAVTSSAAFAASAHRQQQALEQRNVSLSAGAVDSNNWFEVERSDRASSPYAGGN